MTHSDLQGTFQSLDLPPYAHADGKVFTMQFSGEQATLWMNDSNFIEVLAHGTLTITNNPPLFQFKFFDADHRHVFDQANGLDFKDGDPRTFILDIPEHGKRFFQAL